MTISAQPNAGHRPSGWRADDLYPADVDHLLLRFSQRVDTRGPDECWPWTGYLRPGGYGHLAVASLRRQVLVHRIAWVLYTGKPLTDQLTVDHLCNRPSCVNPRHLEAVSMAENNRRRSVRQGHQIGPGSERIACLLCGVQARRDKMRRHARRFHDGNLA